jgi:hypothetical protein
MHETDGVGHPIALQVFEMAIDISQITNRFAASEIVTAVLAVVIVLALIYAANFAARLVLRFIHGDHLPKLHAPYPFEDEYYRTLRVERKLWESKSKARGEWNRPPWLL